jgi:hypothetical protein
MNMLRENAKVKKALKAVLLALIFAASGKSLAADVNAAEFGAIPNDGKDDTHAVKKALESVKKGDSLVFDKGTYDFISHLEFDKDKCHIGVFDKENFKIKGATENGKPATVLMRHIDIDPEKRVDLPQIMVVRDCDNITIENIVSDNFPRATSAGIVVEKDPQGYWIRVRIFDDLPMVDSTGCDSSNAWLPTEPPVFKKVRSLTYGNYKGTWRIHDEENRIMELTHNDGKKLDFLDLIDVGEYMSWHYGAMGNNQMIVQNNTNLVMQNIYVPNILHAFVNLSFNNNVLIKDVVFKSDNSSMAVGSRDALHMSTNRGKMIIDNVYIEGVRLDPVVLRTRYGHVNEVKNKRNLNCQFLVPSSIVPQRGDSIVFWDKEGLPCEIKVESSKYISKPVRGLDVTLQADIPDWVTASTPVKSSIYMPDEVIIRNCTFKNNAGSDIIAFHDNITFKNNLHFRPTDAAIVLGSNRSSAGVCGTNIQILDSNFIDCGWGGKGGLKGAIISANRNKYKLPRCNDVLIKGNTFRGIEIGAAMNLKDLNNCLIVNNRFINVVEKVRIDPNTTADINIDNMETTSGIFKKD